MVLHIGLKKTGSSALQGFFEENLDDLQKQGIFYPQSRHASVKYFFSHNIFKKIKEFNPKINYDDKTYFLQTGNAAYILDQYEKNPTLFDDIYKDALRNNCHTVILSSENMTTDPESLYRVLKKYPQFDIHVIMYIREVYSYFWTYYQQKLKHTHTYYIPYTEIILPIDIENWVDSSFKNEKILVTNYDVHKEHLVTNFFDKLAPFKFQVQHG